MFTSEDLKQRLHFIRLDAQAIDVLKSFSGIIEDKLPSILTSFYEHIGKYPDVSRFFNDTAHMKSAASKQVEHCTQHCPTLLISDLIRNEIGRTGCNWFKHGSLLMA